MNLILKLKSFFRRSVSIASPEGWRDDTSETISEHSLYSLSTAWACLNLVCGTFSQLPIDIFKTSVEGIRVPYREHHLYRILHDSPNADQTALEFWECMAMSVEIKGNAFATIDRGIAGKIIGLTPIHPDSMSVKRNSFGEIEYKWADGGKSYSGTDLDVLHIRGFGGDALGGLSTLAYGAKTFGLASTINNAASSTFKNAVRPSGALILKDFIGNDKRDQVKAALTSEFSGSVNAGKPMILEGGASWQALSINPEDSQMLQSRSFSIEEICRFFNVPPFMIGHTEKTTSFGTGLAEQVLAFKKFSLGRRVKRFEQRLMKQLLTPQDRADGVVIEFNFEGLLRGDTTARYAAYEIALRNGFTTINRVLRRENELPIEGGDVARMQAQNIPITSAPSIGDKPKVPE